MNVFTTKFRLSQLFSNFNSVYFMQPLFNACFYGLKSFFVLYIINQLTVSAAEAMGIYSMFMALCYGTTVLGGYLADQGLGVKNSVVLGGVLAALGLFCVFSPSEDLFFIGLALVSLGSGLFKPNLMTAIGLTFEDPKDPRKDKAYSTVYIVGNIGTFFLPALCGFIGKIYGWLYALMLVVIVLIGATYLVYKTMRFHPSYKVKAPVFSSVTLWGIILLLVPAICLLFKYRDSFHQIARFIAVGSLLYPGRILYQCQPEERKEVWSIIGYIMSFALLVSFGEQSGSSLLLFLENEVDRNLLGINLPSPTILSLNPLFVVVWGFIVFPLCNRYLEKAKSIEGLFKMGCGFLLVAGSFWILALGTYRDAGVPVPLFWVVSALFIQTLGELLIVPMTLSKISKSAPLRFQGVLMSFWTMAIAYGHYFAGIIAQFSINPATTGEGSIDHYQSFFFSLGLIPLGIGALLLLLRMVKSRVLQQRKAHE